MITTRTQIIGLTFAVGQIVLTRLGLDNYTMEPSTGSQVALEDTITLSIYLSLSPANWK